MPSWRCSMRSARAEKMKLRSLSSGIGISPRISASIAVDSPRRAISHSANHAAMRWKRGHHSARASGRSISGAKYFSPMPRNAQRGIVGQRVGVGLGELAERFVDRRAAIGRRQRHVDGIERLRAAECTSRRSCRDRAASPRSPSPTVSAAASRAAASARAARSARPASGRSSSSAKRTYFSPARLAAFQRSSPATASSRCRKREATAGAPPTFAAWVRIDVVVRRAVARSRARRGRCAAPADRGRVHAASAGSATDRSAAPAATRLRPVRRE